MGTTIAVYWTSKGPDGRTLRCELVFAAGALEVRVVNDDAPRWEAVTSEADGSNLAEAWRALYEANGWASIDMPASPTKSHNFKIDRSQRIHSDGLVVRVYQIFGTNRYGWDHNREQPPADRPLYHSRDGAEAAADHARQLSGHRCDDVCDPWRVR